MSASDANRPVTERARHKPSSQRVVCHFIRGYLRPTETFVANQIAALSRYTPAVVCRQIISTSEVVSTVGGLPVPWAYAGEHGLGLWSDTVYRVARTATSLERRVQVDALRRTGAHVVHGHYGTDSAFVLSAVAESRLPFVVSYYGYDISRFAASAGGLGRVYLRRVLENASLHLAMTPQMAQDIDALGAPSDRIVVHHHGIDLNVWSSRVGERGNQMTVLMVASLVEKKGHETAIRAFARASEELPSARFRIVGDGPLRSYLGKLAADLGVADRIDFLGYLPHGADLHNEYSSAQVFLHPSRTARNGDAEGLPGSILEAMACGLPVVATRHRGIPFAVTHGTSGFLVDEGDFESAAIHLQALLMNREVAVGMGDEGASRVHADFDVRKQALRLEDLYELAISAGAPAQRW